MENPKPHYHFIHIHGSGHGAWCWYKLKHLLESFGHRVTTLDLSASVIDSRKLEELRTLEDYTMPLIELMETIPHGQKVILVGHSYGGMNIALIMDKCPEKILIAVFLTAFLPDTTHAPSYVLDQVIRFLSEEFQRWQIENAGATEVKEMEDADHMPMLSRPQELYHCLSEIAEKYSFALSS